MRPNKTKAITIDMISSDRLTALAKEYWSPDTIEYHKPYDSNVVENIYQNEIKFSHGQRRIVLLELSQYLENYLWPNYSDNSSAAHLMSIVAVVNEKFRERVPAWTSFENQPSYFSVFIRDFMQACLNNDGLYTIKEKMQMLIFLNHLYNSIERDLIREVVSNTVSYNILECICESQLKVILQKFPNWVKALKRTARHKKKIIGKELDDFEFDTRFLYNLVNMFFEHLDSIGPDKQVNPALLQYCERFLELMIDLESQLPTRRFFNSILHCCNFLTKCQVSHLVNREEGELFSQLLHIFSIYYDFEISDNSGQALSDLDVTKEHYDKVKNLQLMVFKNYPEFKEFSFSSIGSVDTEDKLKFYLKQFNDKELLELCNMCSLLPDNEPISSRNFLNELFISSFQRKRSQIDALSRMPLYPTENIIWNDNIIPDEYFSGDACLALPKLNLQFLTLHDYLLRNFDLFRLESTYEIRQDVEDIVSRLNPWESENGTVIFRGWARMALPLTSFAICEVAKPTIGEEKPSTVRADVSVCLSGRREVRQEWESLRKHDVCLLISIRKPKDSTNPMGFFPEEYGVNFVRGCEIEGMLDENKRVIEDGPEPRPFLKGDTRTYRVWLDCSQYKLDMDNNKNLGTEDVYESFNVIMRRKPKENNFKSVLETIRDLMNIKCVVPDWLLDIILGYGDPGAAHYSHIATGSACLDFNDTFLDSKHLMESFPTAVVKFISKEQVPPFILTFKDLNKGKTEGEETKVQNNDKCKPCVLVESYTIPSRGPYPYTVPKKNCVKFTPTQIEAIKSGMQPGLTMVVGPPGTGKTDVAVQIIANIYRNNPKEHTLIVTHSNQALNQLFEKIMGLDVDERHLLRLGHGEEALETEKDFSRYGRVNYVLNKRLELLKEVTRLKDSLGVTGEMGASCETAGYFFLQHILSKWEKYYNKIASHISKAPISLQDISDMFPFHVFFSNSPQPLFKGQSYEEDFSIAEGCFRYLENIFTQLEEFRAFEMMRSGLDRTRYLLVREAKIIAMTCTHAALKRRELVELGFQFDNILMEESAQILEIETFIPLLLQNPKDGRNRLKRWIMIGDHHQLPPVIKNMAFQKFSNMEQSLFTRFVRLGVPTVELDAQGRARPSICSLYKWRYKSLGNLPHVLNWSEYKVANAGLFFDFQLIDVLEMEGRGESEPRKYFYQNLAEAEYVVHLFMYMRLLGYPADSISMLTTYNGQKELLKDIVEQRCANNPLFGRPHKISTVDKYQGQQNDYILLSLVRTKAVGHIRDVRRLVVAMSRARLGLYIFAKVSLFKNCFELQKAFQILAKRPLQLFAAPWEKFPTERLVDHHPNPQPVIVTDVRHMGNIVRQLYEETCQAYQAQYEAEVEEMLWRKEPGELDTNELPPDTGARYDSDEETTANMIVNEVIEEKMEVEEKEDHDNKEEK